MLSPGLGVLVWLLLNWRFTGLGERSAVLIIESKSPHNRQRTILGVVGLLLLKSIGGILTMTVYVTPKPPPPPGFRFLGFPRRNKAV
jgi:hypothetical protein